MSGWRSTKDGKHFRTKSKPGISSNDNTSSNTGLISYRGKLIIPGISSKNNISSNHTGTQPSSIKEERKQIRFLNRNVAALKQRHDIVQAYEEEKAKQYDLSYDEHYLGNGLDLSNKIYDTQWQIELAEQRIKDARYKRKLKKELKKHDKTSKPGVYKDDPL